MILTCMQESESSWQMEVKNKSVADHITKDNDHDGIGVFLQEHFDLQIIRIWGVKKYKENL